MHTLHARLLGGILLGAAVLATGCSQLRDLAEQAPIGKPTAEIARIEVTDFSFDKVDLLFHLDVRNDNPVALDVAALEYRLRIDGADLISGSRDQGLTLKARGVSPMTLPVSLRFADLQRIAAAVFERDQLDYELLTDVRVDLPVLGVQSVPASTRGTLPVPKTPQVSLADLRIDSLSLSGAALTLKLAVRNPNAFALVLQRLNYDLIVNGARWGGGGFDRAVTVGASGDAVLDLPLRLDVAALGQGAWQLLSQRRAFDYRLTGGLNLDTSLPLLKGLDLPIDLSGRLDPG